MTVINKILQAELGKLFLQEKNRTHENRCSGELKTNFVFVDGQL